MNESEKQQGAKHTHPLHLLTLPHFIIRYNKRHVALRLAYVGWDYHGFASQEGVNTIEVITTLDCIFVCISRNTEHCQPQKRVKFGYMSVMPM